jgi:hypothetical protein
MPKSLSRGRARPCLSVAAGLLASPLVLAAAADPFAPFPVADGEASDPRIETLRASLRPEAFKPMHDMVMSDAIYFKASGLRKYVKHCGGDPSLTTLLPKEGTPATPFRVRFENPEAPIRAYVGSGYACTFPARFGPLAIGYDAPPAQGLITYADGSYWLGEVSGGANPQSRESNLRPITTGLTPTPAGLGEWGRPDGTRVQGIARKVGVPAWPKSWTSGSVVGFEMAEIRRAALPEGQRLADNLRPEDGRAVAGRSAPTSPEPTSPEPTSPEPTSPESTSPESILPAPAVAAVKAYMAANPDAFPAVVETPGALPAPAAPAAVPPATNAGVQAPAIAAAPPPVPTAENPDVALYAERIEIWRAAMAATDFSTARSSSVSLGLHKPKDYRRHVEQCGGSQLAPVRISFAGTGAKIEEFTGFAPGCALPDQPSAEMFGLIRYADGSRWLGQVIAMEQAEAVQLSGWGGIPAPVYSLVPAPVGLGEWTRVDGTRLQVIATPMRAKYMFRENWLQGPLASFEVSSVSQLLTADGGAYTGDLRFANDRVDADNATGRWADGRRFTGSLADGRPVAGTLTDADGGRIQGRLVAGDEGRVQWEAGADLVLPGESEAGPAGAYRHYARLPFDAPKLMALPLRGARPMDAATVARATRNTRQCARPSQVPQGWVTWWPSCEPGADGRVALYSRDALQELTQYASGQPARFVLRKGFASDPVRGVEILANAFDASAYPSPQGEGELRLFGERTIFIGGFASQSPNLGQCPVPGDEGGGWESCQFSGYERVDALHRLRLERQELARQQEELRRQMEQEAEAERYAQEEWEAEQEQAELREQIRQDEIAGRMAIANAIRGAAYDIGMAYAEREAARDAADYRERQAAREAARPAYSSAPSSSGGYGGPSGQGNQERAAQLAARQAELERRQAELRQRQALASAPRPSPTPSPAYAPSAGSSSGQGTGGGTESYFFTIADHNVGRVSATRQILGLAVTVEIRRVGLRISGADRSEICANFENRSAANWSGGYRLTDQDGSEARSSLSVPAGGIVRKCDTLNPQSGYTVVLRQDRG